MFDFIPRAYIWIYVIVLAIVDLALLYYFNKDIIDEKLKIIKQQLKNKWKKFEYDIQHDTRYE